VRPVGVLGHSVGEIAAAECCGLVSRADALRVVYKRSQHQEFVRGKGRMLVLGANPVVVEDLLSRANASEVDIAAYNSAASTTISGPAAQIEAVSRLARQARIASVALNLDYPFHSRALDPVGEQIVADLSGMATASPKAPFYSTVTGRLLAADELDARYWWRNIRRPVRFAEAVEAALAAQPAAAFVELGPRAILAGPISDILRACEAQNPVVATLSANDPAEHDPIRGAVARIVANGVLHEAGAVFGDVPGRVEALPPYPFQPEQFRFDGTSEAITAHGSLIANVPLHPLLGARLSDGSPEWRNLLDPVLLPYLDDHRVDSGVVLPASALIEMALAAGRELFGAGPLELAAFDITKAMTFGADETREVSTRHFDQTDTIEIWSRRRFAGSDWILHARGTVTRLQASAVSRDPQIPRVAEPILSEAHAIYTAAERAGLDYGPRFRIVVSTRRDETIGESRLLVPQGGVGAYEDRHVLHPVSLDGSFHGLFLARPNRDGERKAHLPIRFRRIRIWKPDVAVTRSVTKLLTETERFKTLSVSLLDDDGELVASIEAAVLRSVHLVRPFMPERTFRNESVSVEPLPLPLPPFDPEAERADDERQLSLLLRACAISLAHALCRDLLSAAPGGGLDSIAVDGTVAPAARPLLAMARDILAMSGALDETPGGTRPSQNFGMPSPAALLGTLLQRFPQANREIRLVAQALSLAGEFARTGSLDARAGGLAYDQWSLRTLSGPLRRAVGGALAAWTAPAARKLRLLVVGDWNDGLMEELAGAVRNNRVSVTLVASNQARADELRHWPGVGSLFDMLVLHGAERPATAAFDALIGFGLPLSPFQTVNDSASSAAIALLANDAPILLAAPADDLHLAFLLGASTPAVWQDRAAYADGGQDALRRRLEAARATAIEAGPSLDGALLLARARAPGATRTGEPEHVAILAGSTDGDQRLRYGLRAAELFDRERVSALGAWLEALPQDASSAVIVAPGGIDAAPAERLAARLDDLGALLKILEGSRRSCRLLVLTGAAHDGADDAGEDAAVWAFMRVAINEFPDVDIRLVDLAQESAAGRIGEILSRDDAERELRIGAAEIEVSRSRRGLVSDKPLGPEECAELRFAEGVGFDGFEWNTRPCRAPQDGEIEVEVVAVGLNYRDVMVGLGLLDDDLLGAGLTRGALGFECSGRVRRVGAGVTRLKPGDAVMGFAAGAFASRLVCPDWHFFSVPEGLDLEAAATVPVAFATAWYALVERGHVRPGDEVLVHGAAGGVGLAAIQIAKLHGARVLGTASSEARRAIARAAGADEVFDSRHERFADAIRAQGGGVDIVLNSLAGSAMLASFRLLKPFGRFLELGKRDFLDNTQLALRPFLRNIAYSGIDLDELLAADPALVRRMMAALAKAFRDGGLRPLTYRRFEAHEVGTAFRMMQASEHIGKIIIRPPRFGRRDLARLNYAARPGLYLVVGGTTGLGFATARWLARKGASHIVLLSRRGKVEPGLESQLAEMRAAGARLLVESLDIGDAAAVRETVARLVEEHGPLRGVVHAAVHLDDGLIANLVPERLRAVLHTKVDGVLNLAAATDDQPLDFFVTYSSATTLVGSPGQGAYVAANGFLEGFARRRRQLGKPALAIGWGAIADVGLIARDKQLGHRLRRSTGVVPMRSSEALAHLGRLLALGEAAEPVQYYAGIAAGGGGDRLALLRSAAFADLSHPGGESKGAQPDEVGAALRGRSREEAIEIVTAVLRREVADILRMAENRVDLARPLADLGLDSLMALELHMAMEAAIGVQIAVVGAADRSLLDMAGAIVAQLHRGEAPAEPAMTAPENLQSTIIRLASAHSQIELSPEQADRIEAMVHQSNRGTAE
jgi:NADPH:quinone reductase-like Zn-dependent oxidoreductase/acyl transferase domain-containing protein/acyl carrier protein